MVLKFQRRKKNTKKKEVLEQTCVHKLMDFQFSGVPWTEDEHRMFLLGLQKLGKGDWRGIARNFVVSRTPTQVASHAQKYFIRQTNVSRRKRRSSLFDIIADEVSTLNILFSLTICNVKTDDTENKD